MRHYPFSTACIVLILVLSFCHPPQTEVSDAPGIDKLAHLLMYFLTVCVIRWEYARRHDHANALRLFLFSFCAPILLGGAIELAQEYLTTHRGGEWADFAANALGVVAGTRVGHYIFPPNSRR